MPITPYCYLAVDLGASSGRAVIGMLDGEVMRTEEVHRFRTPMVETGGRLSWELEALWNEVLVGLRRALREVPSIRSVSIDSWAADYVPLAEDGSALRRPFTYRDPRTAGQLDQAVERFGADALYARTGTQFLPFNTLPQVMTDLSHEPELVSRTHTRLLIADYLLFRLSGLRVAERTIASTTQLYDVRAGCWAADLIRAVGDDEARWPQLVSPGTLLGPARFKGAGRESPHVVATCSHDTASAIAAVPAADGGTWAYVSSGTWSLIGAELRDPILTPEARMSGFTNEVGLDETIRFLKNRTGMWVLEECIREWEESGERPSYEELLAAAAGAPPPALPLDLDHAPFAQRGGMEAKLAAACRDAGLPVPGERGELVRLILESLAATYARTIRELEALTGTWVDVLHIVGGGARIHLLNQLTSNACGRRVAAGPYEATVLGNLLVQARSLGDLPPGVSVRHAARASSHITEYAPADAARPPIATSSG